MPSLTAGRGLVTLSGLGLGKGMFARAGKLALTGQPIRLAREYTVGLGELSLRLDRLEAQNAIVDAQGRPTGVFQRKWQRHCESIEASFGALRDAVLAIQTAYDAAAQAQQAVTEVNSALVTVQDTVATASQFVEDLQDGTMNLAAITIGGKKFVNDNGDLVTE